MAAEIERKFLLDELPEGIERNPSAEIEQAYLAVSPEAEVRVRRREGTCTLTVKKGVGEEREEVEVEIDPARFESLWRACGDRRLAKRRHLVSLGDLTAEIDVYRGPLAGLRVAEVEFPSREAARSFQPPSWFGREVTGDDRYANQSLAIAGIPTAVADDMPTRSYSLKGDEPFAEGMRRIAAGRADKAVERLQAPSGEAGLADAVHGARKDMKKLRTVLRLLRDALPKEVREEETDRYRQAARALAATRDSEVKLRTLESLAEGVGELPAGAVDSWRRILDRGRETAANLGKANLDEAAAAIEAGRAGIESWRLERGEPKAVDGLTRIYRRGRRAMRDAEADPSEPNLHQWRKRAKDLRYGLELFAAAWSGPLEATAEEAHRLTDLLGDHHDLAMLREDLGERRLGDEETRALAAAIGARQERLAADALDLGRRLYAERPKDFRRRFRRYWKAWRG